MFDEKTLDGRRINELLQALDFVMERMDKIEEESDGEDGPRLDGLIGVADLIVKRLRPLVREAARDDPVALATWDGVVRAYERSFERYDDAILSDDVLIDGGRSGTP